jgi:hypothetical protein
MSDMHAPYTVRRPGCTAWTTCETAAEAVRERDLANRICAEGHLIYDRRGGRNGAQPGNNSPAQTGKGGTR